MFDSVSYVHTQSIIWQGNIALGIHKVRVTAVEISPAICITTNSVHRPLVNACNGTLEDTDEHSECVSPHANFGMEDNREKSELEPKQTFTFIGVVYDLQTDLV